MELGERDLEHGRRLWPRHGRSRSAAASSNNGAGVASVAWNNMIMPLVVLDSIDSATYSNMASAVNLRGRSRCTHQQYEPGQHV